MKTGLVSVDESQSSSHAVIPLAVSRFILRGEELPKLAVLITVSRFLPRFHRMAQYRIGTASVLRDTLASARFHVQPVKTLATDPTTMTGLRK